MSIPPRPETSRAAPIKLVVFDVDGVLTDGRIIIDDHGLESKFFHVRDGQGLALLRRGGLDLAIITGRKSGVVEHRAADLKIERLYQGVKDKVEVYERIKVEASLRDKEIAFAGDDLIDLKVMQKAGLAMAPADAAPEVLAAAHFVSRFEGGRGAVREMSEFILKSQKKWDSLIAAL